MAKKMAATGVKLLWGTANLFSHPRYAGGASTSPDPEVFAWAAAQVRCCLEATHRLGGENYVLWGGREGYDSLLNTDLRRELDQYGRFLSMVVEHKHDRLQGHDPHRAEAVRADQAPVRSRVAAVYAFLQRYGLTKEVKVNIEVNHATLAGLDFEHEIAAARAYGIFGSIDINRGDPRNGWDTDQFPNNAQELVPALVQLVEDEGFAHRRVQLRRQAASPVGGSGRPVPGAYRRHRHHRARVARRGGRRAAGEVERLRQERYKGWSGEFGQQITGGGWNWRAWRITGARPRSRPTLRPAGVRREPHRAALQVLTPS